MLIGFVGAPCSGKTTIATKSFVFLKENHHNTELITEEARKYIAELRFASKDTTVNLKLEDQDHILQRQYESENVMKYGCPKDTIIISDSSVYNTSLYNGYIDTPDRPFFKSLKNHYDLLVFCHPLALDKLPVDPNRVHDLDQVNQLANKSLKLLSIIKELGIPTVELLGFLKLNQRYEDAVNGIMKLYVDQYK